MKPLIVTAIFLATVVFLSPFVSAENQPTIQVKSIVLYDNWGTQNSFLNRGYKTNLFISLSSIENGSLIIITSLVDVCNTPSGYSKKTFDIVPGENNLSITLDVTPYAFVGLANLHIVILNTNNQMPISSVNVNAYIKILGDFDNNNSVNSQDIAILSKAYSVYWENNAIPNKYQSCDITGDKKLTSNDLAAFSNAYINFWSTSNQ
jgi:hypothetical protein